MNNEDEQQYRSQVAAQLAKPLLPALVAELNAGRRGDHDYIPIHVAITQANRIFGHGNWSTEIIKHEPMLNAAGEFIGYVCIARVKIPKLDVQYEGIGVQPLATNQGKIQDTSTSHDMAAKGAESDAIKRALRYLGDTFGNGLYEKEDERLPVARMAVSTLRRRLNCDEQEAEKIVMRGYRALSEVPISVSLSHFYEALTMEQAPNAQRSRRDDDRGEPRRDDDRGEPRRGQHRDPDRESRQGRDDRRGRPYNDEDDPF